MAKILIIDDDRMICESLARIFEKLGHEVASANSTKEGLGKAKSDEYDIVFLDLQLPDGNGIDILPDIKATPSAPEVIILTGFPDAESAEVAIKSAAWDYLKKPAPMGSVKLVLSRALQYREEKKSAKPKVTRKNLKRESIIGNSPEVLACLDLVGRAAESDANILVSGETGTGKELFSRAIHANSRRSKGNFVVVDCASMPETLIENLLFGHKKGAYTGADRAEEGLVKHADGGTLFLDEIGELSLPSQKSFLRVLQERQFRPLGGTTEIKSDFRLISASNRNLEEMVKAGKFREDLLFRLRSIMINLPPLVKRGEDIKDLAMQYVAGLCEVHKTGMKGFSPDFFDVLASHRWPGNVRELYSTLEWTVAQALLEPTIFPQHLPAHIRVAVAKSSFGETEETPSEPAAVDTTDLSEHLPKWQEYRNTIVSEGEKRYLKALFSKSGSGMKKASELSGLSEPRLYQLLRKHKMSAG